LVLAPQMKKVKNNNQKSPRFTALPNAAKAMTMGFVRACAGSVSASPVSPKRCSPIEEGCSGSNSATIGNTSAAETATNSTMGCQP
jgi:hypothetical protein